MQIHARQETLKKELEALRYRLPECTTLEEYDMVHLQIAFYKDLLKKYNPVPRYKENRVNVVEKDTSPIGPRTPSRRGVTSY